MKRSKFYDAISGIRDDLIDNAAVPRPKKRYPKYFASLAAMLAVALCVYAVIRPGAASSACAIAEAEYPSYDSVKMIRADYGDDTGLQSYFAQSTRQLLANASTENAVCSPVNLYMALSMLAETTAGTSQDQILAALGSASMEELRGQSQEIWEMLYTDNDSSKLLLANSLWLDQGLVYNEHTVATLTGSHYASVYQGAMGSASLDRALQDWVNDQTHGLVKKLSKELSFPPSTAFGLVSTVYYKSAWGDEFYSSGNTEDAFYAPNGEVTLTYMNQSRDMDYFWGENFSAVKKHLKSGSMWFILPDEGTQVSALLSEDAIMELIMDSDDWENQQYMLVHFSVPKFDVSSQLNLTETLQSLGITDVLDESAADFSPMLENSGGIHLTSAKQGVRLRIDEEGCEAAAYTAIANGSGAPADDEITFVLDRPFLFVLAQDDLPVFVGVINQP